MLKIRSSCGIIPTLQSLQYGLFSFCHGFNCIDIIDGISMFTANMCVKMIEWMSFFRKILARSLVARITSLNHYLVTRSMVLSMARHMLRFKKREHPRPQASHPTGLQEAQLWPTLGCWVVLVPSYASQKFHSKFFFGKVSLGLNNNGREYDRICWLIFLFYILFYLQGCISHFWHRMFDCWFSLDFCSRSISREGGAADQHSRKIYILTTRKISGAGRILEISRLGQGLYLCFIILQVLISPSVKLQKSATVGWACSCEPWLVHWKGTSRNCNHVKHGYSESIEANNVFAWICVK